MGAGHADYLIIVLHKLTEQRAAFHDGNAQLTGHRDFGVAVGNRGGAHDKAGVLDKLRLMPYGARDPNSPKLLQSFGFLLIGAGYPVSRFYQHECQAAHGNATDPCEMNGFILEIFYMHQA